jgi:anti-sigma regulatory factor (Ser/Thr protein kinase)
VSTTGRIPPLLAEAYSEEARLQLRELVGGELTCQTREDAEQLADHLARLLPDPAACRLGLVELMLNAVEHGNLEIGTTLKANLLREHQLEHEIARRLAREPYRSRRVRDRVVRAEPEIEIEIHDEGPGFALRPVLGAELAPSERPNGRGIALTRAVCFPTLEYRDPGNIVIVRVAWPTT